MATRVLVGAMLKKEVDIRGSFYYYATIMRNRIKMLILILLFFLTGCYQKKIKTPITYIERPQEPQVIKITKLREEEKEKLREKVSEIVKELPLSIKIGQIIMSYPPKYDSVKKYQIGGIILNQNFIKDTLSTKLMCEKYNKQTLIPLFFAIDQEGGKVNRLKHIEGYEKTPSATELASSFSNNELLEYAYNTAITMRKLGLNVNLAPSLDLSSDENALMRKQERTLGGNPYLVKEKAKSLIDGYKAGGILVFAKHFPGYDDVEINSDITVAFFNYSTIEIVKNLILFVSLSNKIDGVMMSSVIYSDFDSTPALFSKSIIELIRISNPDIIIMTDDLYAPSLRMLEKQNLSMIATKSFIAGNDILLILWDLKVPVLIEAIKNTLYVKPELSSQLDRSVERILLSKERVYPGLIKKLYNSWVR